jgi:predicted DsbA family dithiol-disulfide isomerase
LDAATAREILAGDRYAAEVRAEEQRWLQLGIHSVPSVVVNGRHLIQGGQPPEVFEQALRQIAAG